MPRKVMAPEASLQEEGAFGEQEMMALGREFRRLRLQRGWSLQRLATESGISVAGIQKIERGNTNPSLQTAVSLSDALGQPLPDLVVAARDAIRSVTMVHGSVPLIADTAVDLSGAIGDRAMRAEILSLSPKKSVEKELKKAPLFIYVLEGSVSLQFSNGRLEHLRAQDAIHLHDEVPTRIENSVARRSVLLCVSDLRS